MRHGACACVFLADTLHAFKLSVQSVSLTAQSKVPFAKLAGAVPDAKRAFDVEASRVVDDLNASNLRLANERCQVRVRCSTWSSTMMRHGSNLPGL